MPIYYETWNPEKQRLELTADPRKAISNRMIIGTSDVLDWKFEHNQFPTGYVNFPSPSNKK